VLLETGGLWEASCSCGRQEGAISVLVSEVDLVCSDCSGRKLADLNRGTLSLRTEITVRDFILVAGFGTAHKYLK
jgi:hypothetical protein